MRRIGTTESFAPYLTVEFINPENGEKERSLALVDTGADACSVSTAFAEALGHNIARGTPGKTHTASHRVSYWQHTFTINIFHTEILGPDEIFVDYDKVILTLPNILVDALDCPTPELLGVRGFLENYVLTANYPRQLFSINDFKGV
jgi:hypothetical protein